MSDAPQRITPDPKPLTRAERIVLRHLAMYADADGRLVQSLRRIADATFLSHMGVQKAIDRLNERQLIRTVAGSVVRTGEHLVSRHVLERPEPGNTTGRSASPSGRAPRVGGKAAAGGAR